VKRQKQNKKGNKAPKRCCRTWCIGCPWTIAQLKRKK